MKKTLSVLFLMGVCFGANLADIQKDKVIKIGVRMDQTPFSAMKNGSFEGFEVELAKAVAKKIAGNDVKIELIGVNAKDRVPFLQDGRADIMFANMTVTPERMKSVDCSMPYLSSVQSLISKKGSNIKKISDLRDCKILVIPGTTSFDYVKAHPQLGIKDVECENSKDCFKKFQDGEADAYLHTNILNATWTLMDGSLEVSLPVVGEYEFIAVAVAKDNKELLKAVNDALMSLSSEGEFQKLYRDILEPYYRGKIEKKYLLLDDVYNSLSL